MTQFENYCTVPGFEFSTRYCGYFLHLIYVGRGAVFRSACQVEDGSGWNHAAFVYLLSFLEIQINTSFESFILAPLGSKQVGFWGWMINYGFERTRFGSNLIEETTYWKQE